MEDQFKERWYQLCVLATAENDRAKLFAMMTEINRFVDRKGTITTTGKP
jgi:hypothetical protein